MTSVPSLLRGVLRQSGETSLQRIGGAGRPCAATVTCHAWHGSGRAAGGRGEHHPPGTVGVGAG